MRKSGAFHFKDADEAQADYERIEEPEPLLFFFTGGVTKGEI